MAYPVVRMTPPTKLGRLTENEDERDEDAILWVIYRFGRMTGDFELSLPLTALQAGSVLPGRRPQEALRRLKRKGYVESRKATVIHFVQDWANAGPLEGPVEWRLTSKGIRHVRSVAERHGVDVDR